MRFRALIFLFLISPALALSANFSGLVFEADFPSEVNSSSFTFNISINNTTNESRTFEMYSYVYEGSKSVSGSWTYNVQVLNVRAYDNITTNLTNYLKEVNGIYPIKLRIIEGTKENDLKSYITINQSLKKPGLISGYSVAAKTAAYAGLSLVGLAGLYVVMKKI